MMKNCLINHFEGLGFENRIEHVRPTLSDGAMPSHMVAR